MKDGYKNEIDFINYLNNKKYKEVNIIMQELIKKLFPKVNQENIIRAYKYGKYAKTDVVIKIEGIEKGISIKCGSKNSVHLEEIKEFTKYIQKLGFIENDKLLRYLYSDGTNNNTGTKRESASEYKENHVEDIKRVNKELEKIKEKLINRFLIKTDINYRVKVDAFILGTINDFIWATQEEVVEYLVNEKQDSTGVHVSNLFIQNWNKNLKYNEKYEHCRNYIQVKWFSMFDDILKIMCTRNKKW